MAVSHNDCAPFLSLTLLRHARPAPSIADLRRAILDHLKKGIGISSVSRTVHAVNRPTFRDGNIDVGWIHYTETRPPAWYLAADLTETHQHSIFILTRGDLVALAFSDGGIRNAMISEIRKRRVKSLERLMLLNRKQINDSFVRNRVRTLWLSGAHRRTSTKPDSKILSGLELEAALNPLEDQSYYFSSVRSTHDNLSINSVASSLIVGASPRNARAWIGPSKDWKAFIRRAEALIDVADAAIATPAAAAAPLPVLASPVDGLGGAEQPYDMAIIVLEAISAGGEEDREDRWLHEFSDAARFAITPKTGSPSFVAEVFWGPESYGRIEYEFTVGADGSVSASASPQTWKTSLDYQEDIRKICLNTDLLTVYFDTGHTFAQGHFYETRFRDARFSNWTWAKLADFEIDAEKPLVGKKLNIAGIGAKRDLSLFGHVAKHWPDLLASGTTTGWLVCDDGSMESADFVHFDDSTSPPRLSLIHVKGSGSDARDRGISVSDYEVVVGQAIKNLRYLDRTSLAEKLGLETDKKIASAVWRNGARQKNREGVVKALKAAGSNLKKAVYVLQPRVTKSAIAKVEQEINAGRLNKAEVRRLQQLDTLLLAARAECLGLDAEFHVIGEDDGGQAAGRRHK
jgi:hypothetical protein